MKGSILMEFHQLKCPNCGATLEVKDDLDAFYCMYCGTNILATGRDKEVYKAKAKIKVSENELEKRRLELEYEEKEDNRTAKNAIIAYCIMMAGIALFIFLVNFI